MVVIEITPPLPPPFQSLFRVLRVSVVQYCLDFVDVSESDHFTAVRRVESSTAIFSAQGEFATREHPVQGRR
jgi:hypothetical protein